MIQILAAVKALISMMGITGALNFLKALPNLIRIFGEIIKVIREVKDSFARKERTKEVHEAIKVARETGNTSKLESLFK